MNVSGYRAHDAGVGTILVLRAPIARWLAASLVVLSLALFLVGLFLFRAHAPNVGLVRLQWAGSAATANKIVAPAEYGRFRVAIYWDLGALVPGYTLGLVGATVLGRRLFWTPPMQRAALAGLGAAIAAGGANVIQDVLLLSALSLRPARGDWVLRFAAAASFIKFALILVAAAPGLIAWGTAIGRLALHKHTASRWHRAARDARCGRSGLGPADLVRCDRPEATSQNALGGTREETWGICLPGGGIRSATVALGALQSLQTLASKAKQTELGRIRYLVSVSGGGYTAGAFQLALQANKGKRGAGPRRVFAPGSPEEDHLRRHSSYVADTAGQWLMALGVLFRCVATGIALIGLAIAALGLAIGRFYREVPIVTRGLAGLKPLFLAHPRTVEGKLVPPPPGWPVIPWGVTLAVLVALALAVLAYLVEVSFAGKICGGARWLGKVLAGAAILLIALGIAIPAFVWLSSWLTWRVDFTARPAVATGSLTVLISFLGALVGTLWRKRTTITKTAGAVKTFFTKSPGGQVLPNSMAQMLLLWVCLLVLILAAVLASGWVATSGLDASWWAFVPVGVLLVIAVFADETWFSLYPFYRRRLAGAFATKRCADRPGVQSLEDTSTPLSQWGKRVSGFPEVRFAATANITRQDLTPPGRRAVSFVFGSDYVGGPQLGWVRTDFLEKLAAPVISRDIEVGAAMTISGAAFASAMGSQTRFYEVFLALTNVRLGVWLPNPRFVALKYRNPSNWTLPGLPSRRRLGHLVREIFGIHPSYTRMLLCTDGGHRDNLGLTELLDLRCSHIYCFDASGGGAPLADTLAGTITLACEERGVGITLTDDAYDLVPGGADPPTFAVGGPLASMNARISKRSVITGEITYPSGTTATLIFAQAGLTKELPYQVLDYAHAATGFPRDSTADQWFNCDQFDAYQQLGRYLGQQAIAASQTMQQKERSCLPMLRRRKSHNHQGAVGDRGP